MKFAKGIMFMIAQFILYTNTGGGHTDIQTELNKLTPGQALWMKGNFQISGGISLPDIENVGIYLDGSISTPPGSTPFSGSSLITLATGRRGQFIIGSPGSRLDGNHRVDHLIRGTACRDSYISTLKLLNWKYGIYLDSQAGTPFAPLINPKLEDLELINEATADGVEYPIQISSRAAGKRVMGGEIRRCTVISVPGAHVKVDPDANPPILANLYTADQIALQGVEDFLVADCKSYNGGENGFAVSRCSQRVSFVRCQGVGADLNGIQVGSAVAAIWVADITGWAAGNTLTGQTSGRVGTISAIVDYGSGSNRPARYEVRLTLSTSPAGVGFFEEGEDVSNGPTEKPIIVLEYTDHVMIQGCYFVDNGADADESEPAKAGVYATRARWLSIDAMCGNKETSNQQFNGHFTSSLYNADQMIPTGTVGTAETFVATAPGSVNLSKFVALEQIAGATVAQSGAIKVASGCSVQKAAGYGVYNVTLTDSLPGSADAYFVSVTLEQTDRDMPPQVTDKTATTFKVRTFDSAGTPTPATDTAFALGVWRID